MRETNRRLTVQAKKAEAELDEVIKVGEMKGSILVKEAKDYLNTVSEDRGRGGLDAVTSAYHILDKGLMAKKFCDEAEPFVGNALDELREVGEVDKILELFEEGKIEEIREASEEDLTKLSEL